MNTNKTTFTPGPLAIKQRPGTIGVSIQTDGKTIGAAYSINDGKLWAAAPDLLAALESVLIASEDGGDFNDVDFNGIRAAIAKARGQ